MGGDAAAAVDDGPVARYASASGVSFLSVDYRLAPKHPYPAAVEDAYAGLVWLEEHAAELGVDPTRIAVMGDSAGTGVAAAVTLMARDRSGPAVASQILLYPMLDDRTITPDPQITPFALWSYDHNSTGWGALLGAAAGGPDVPPYAAPRTHGRCVRGRQRISRWANSTSSGTRTSLTHYYSAARCSG